MIDLLVLADDFTGANESAVQFAQSNVKTSLVTTDIVDFKNPDPNLKVFVVDTNTRNVSPEKAYAVIYRIVEKAYEAGIRKFYKKTDSTLRGNIGAELDAMMKAGKGNTCTFIPAYPDNDRITQNGHQFVDTVPLHNTQFSMDPLNPIKTSYIPDILSEHTKLKIGVYDECMTISLIDEPTICVMNAASNAAIQKIINQTTNKKEKYLLAGSSYPLKCLPLIELTGNGVEQQEISMQAPILIVNGSMTERAFKQIEVALTGGVTSIKLDKEDILDLNRLQTKIESIKKEIVNSEQAILLLYTAESRSEVDDYVYYLNNTKLKSEVPAVITNALSTVTCAVEQLFNVLFVWGGNTSRTVLDSLKVATLNPVREFEPGVSLAKYSQNDQQKYFISKSGDFGSNEIVKSVKKLIR